MRAKRGTEAVEVDVFSKPKRRRTASLLAVDMQAKPKLRSQTSKDEAMGVESEEASAFADGSEQIVILAEKYRHAGLGLERAEDTGRLLQLAVPSTTPTVASLPSSPHGFLTAEKRLHR